MTERGGIGTRKRGGELNTPVTRYGHPSLEFIRRTVRSLRRANILVGAVSEDLELLDSILASTAIVVLGVAAVSVRAQRST